MYFPLNPECIYLDWISQGVLPDQTEVAVKTLSQKSCQGKQEFLNEAALITAVQHRNLVKLKGCCLERDHRILVYEFMENKSLHQTLFGEFHLDLPNKSLEAILKLHYSGKLGSCAHEIALRYVASLWAIPTPQTIWGIRLDLELPHLVSNCESRRVSFQGLESKLRRKNNENRGSNLRFSFSLSNHTGLLISGNCETHNGVNDNLIQSHCNTRFWGVHCW